MANERTVLSPTEDAAFQKWITANGINDLDHPDSHYDYRGFWKSTQGADHPPGDVQHFPDTFKQHGHPFSSVESQYSAGPFDGGRWLPDNRPDAVRALLPLPDRYVPNGADLLSNSRGARSQQIREALLALMANR